MMLDEGGEELPLPYILLLISSSGLAIVFTVPSGTMAQVTLSPMCQTDQSSDPIPKSRFQYAY